MLSGLVAAIAAVASTAAAAAQPPPAPSARPNLILSPAQQLGGRAPTGLDEAPAGGVDASGRALVAWSVYPREGGGATFFVASAAPGAPFGEPTEVGQGDTPLVAAAPDGRAVIAAASEAGPQLLLGDTTGRFGAPLPLVGSRRPSALAMAGDGTAAVVLPDSDAGPIAQLVMPGGQLIPPQRIARSRTRSLFVGGDAGRDYAGSLLAAGPDGTIVLLTPSGLYERRPGGRRFIHRDLPFTSKYAEPQVAVGPRGRIGVAAIDRPLCIGEYGCVGGVVFAERRPGAATFSPVIRPRVRRYPLDDGKRIPSANAPAVAYGARRTPVLAWTEDDDVCTGCDMDTTDGPLIAWEPGGKRTTVTENGFASLVPAGEGIALLTGRAGRFDVFFAGGGRTVKLGSTRLPANQGLSFAGGPSRLLMVSLADGVVRGVVGELRPR